MKRPYGFVLLTLCILLVGFERNYTIPSIHVQHKIEGHNVLVECLVSGVTFRSDEPSEQQVGKMIVWVDGRKHSEVTTAAFIVKGLSVGRHRINLEVVSLNNEPYGLKDGFLVDIP